MGVFYCLLTITEFFYLVFYCWLSCFILLREVSAFITVSTTITITAVTAVTAITAAITITAAVIISGLLLSLLLLVERLDLSYR